MIPIFRPSMGDEEVKAVESVLRSGWLGLGPKTEEFEKKFAEFIGVRYAVALNSCTAALHIALNALGISGRDVLTTPITFVSTAHSIIYSNGRPVFVDVQPDTVNIDPHDIKQKLTEKTKAILPVHYGGHPCEMDEITQIGEDHNLHIIEDAAHACGAEYRGKKCGSLGHIGCFSFHAVKNLATGDGGMLTTNDPELYEKFRKLRWLGINQSTYQRDSRAYVWDYDVEYIGFKEHMNDITAALGIVQLSKLKYNNERRKSIVKRYNEAFSSLEWISVPVERPYVTSSHHNYAIKVTHGDRNALITHLAKEGISSGVHYKPLYLHSCYRKLGIAADTPVADHIWKQLLILPLFPDMKEEEVDAVIREVKKFK